MRRSKRNTRMNRICLITVLHNIQSSWIRANHSVFRVFTVVSLRQPLRPVAPACSPQLPRRPRARDQPSPPPARQRQPQGPGSRPPCRGTAPCCAPRRAGSSRGCARPSRANTCTWPRGRRQETTPIAVMVYRAETTPRVIVIAPPAIDSSPTCSKVADVLSPYYPIFTFRPQPSMEVVGLLRSNASFVQGWRRWGQA